MTIGWPQGIYLVLTAMAVGMALAKDGEPRTPYSFWHSLLRASISFGLLWWGDFFGAHP